MSWLFMVDRSYDEHCNAGMGRGTLELTAVCMYVVQQPQRNDTTITQLYVLMPLELPFIL